MSYQPHPGTVACRVVAYLRESGKPATAAVIGDALDVTPSVIDGSLTHAVRHRLVCKERFNGLMHWRLLPQDTAASVEPDDDEDEKPIVQRVVPPSEWAKRPHVAMNGVDIDGDRRKDDRRTPREPVQDPALPERRHEERRRTAFACGLFSDGRLVLELAGGTDVVLQRGETLELVRFLDRTLTTGELAS